MAAAPGPLLVPLVEDYRRTRGVTVLAPLGLPAWLGRLPGPAGAYAKRRGHDHPARISPVVAADAALHAWAGARTDRRYLAEFLLRAAIDAWTARAIRRLQPETVVCSSLAARTTFAAARAIGARTILVLDLPLLRPLHRDLDRAAAHWPEHAFLRRFRAPSWAIARQEAERALADLVLVRGPYAHALCLADGLPMPRLALLPAAPPRVIPPPPRPTGRVRLAGLAAARHGIDTALAAARLLGKTLVVRPGVGSEPADLTTRPNVAVDDGPVDAIICPAICETYAPELRTMGLPIIASPMASLDGRGPDPYDARALAEAIDAKLA